jgi:hypothetical protein
MPGMARLGCLTLSKLKLLGDASVIIVRANFRPWGQVCLRIGMKDAPILSVSFGDLPI